MEKKNRWLIAMIAGVAIVIVDVITLGSPVVLGVGAALALGSAIGLIAQVLVARRA
ncbi:hypothetical protein [Actinomyces radicidentis]|uniref:hypothetical protein n=1 Tax=Actinomyces radicidentis TaxID=111015 RepID=UPI000A55D084|nr:hypothetical protein [Actinomyces radicidentis]